MSLGRHAFKLQLNWLAEAYKHEAVIGLYLTILDIMYEDELPSHIVPPTYLPSIGLNACMLTL